MLRANALGTVQCSLVLFLLLAPIALSQSHIHTIACKDASSKEGCDLFNEAAEDDDKDLYQAAKQEHVIVCFRPNSNTFFVLSYDSPEESLWQKRDDGGFQQSGNARFSKFVNGRASPNGESVFAVGWWVTESRGNVSRFQGTSFMPVDIGRIEIEPSRIHVIHPVVQNLNNPQPSKAEYDFLLTTSKNEFVETLSPAGTMPTLPPVTGRCVTYK